MAENIYFNLKLLFSNTKFVSCREILLVCQVSARWDFKYIAATIIKAPQGKELRRYGIFFFLFKLKTMLELESACLYPHPQACGRYKHSTWSRRTEEELHCTHCSSGTLHSTESSLHPHIPAQIRAVQQGLQHTQEKGKYLSVLFKLNGSVSQVCGSVKPAANMQTNTRALVRTHARTLLLRAGGDTS